MRPWCLELAGHSALAGVGSLPKYPLFFCRPVEISSQLGIKFLAPLNREELRDNTVTGDGELQILSLVGGEVHVSMESNGSSREKSGGHG